MSTDNPNTMIQEGDILLVEVPEGQQYFDLYGNLQQGQEVVYNKMTVPGKFKQISIPLPPGDYDLIGKASDLTEDDWKKIVDVLVHMEDYERLVKDGYVCYCEDQNMCHTATESGLSLLKKHSMIASKTIILKKKS